MSVRILTRSYLKNTPGLYWVRDPSFVGMTVYYCLNWRCLEMLNHLQFLCSANLIPLLFSSRLRRDLFLLNNIFEMASRKAVGTYTDHRGNFFIRSYLKNTPGLYWV